MKEIEEILKAINGPVKYEPAGQLILTSENQTFLDVRGWGRLKDAELQDAIGEYCAKAINEYESLKKELENKQHALDNEKAFHQRTADGLLKHLQEDQEKLLYQFIGYAMTTGLIPPLRDKPIEMCIRSFLESLIKQKEDEL